MYAAMFAEEAEHGLGLDELAHQTGIRLSTLSWWKREIPRREARRSASLAEFVAVTVRDDDPRPSAIGFEVLLPNRVRIHVPAVFDESVLHTLLVTLVSAC